MTEHAPGHPYTLRTTPTVRRALTETLPEAVAAAAYEFITGPPAIAATSCRETPSCATRRQVQRAARDLPVIYRVTDKTRVVTVVEIGYRRDVYRT
jgi:mRNA interferase RelE/StbE